MAEHVEDTQTYSEHTGTMITPGDDATDTPATIGMKRERETVKSFVETDSAVKAEVPAAVEAPAGEEPPKKVKKLTFKLKKPTA